MQKLTYSDAEDIRKIYFGKKYRPTKQDIAKRFKVSIHTITLIEKDAYYDKHIRNGQPRKLTQEQANTVRAAIKQGAEQKALAQRFGVSERTISQIKLGRSYKDKPVFKHKRPLSHSQVCEVRRLLSLPEQPSIHQLARRYNCSAQNISFILNNITHRRKHDSI